MDLDFHPGLPLEVRLDLTEAARGAGLPLWQLELLGQDEAVAQQFIDAARQGRARRFLEDAEWDVLEARFQARRRKEGGRFWDRPRLTPSFPEVLPMR